jgi:predicted NAD/FAD-dependent oxidoreductase
VSARRLRIAIFGCGTAGPAAAVLLRRQGHEVVLFERAEECKAVGAGLVTEWWFLVTAWLRSDCGWLIPLKWAFFRVLNRVRWARLLMTLSMAGLAGSERSRTGD